MGDMSFFYIKITSERQLKYFPIEKKTERRVILNAFEKD